MLAGGVESINIPLLTAIGKMKKLIIKSFIINFWIANRYFPFDFSGKQIAGASDGST